MFKNYFAMPQDSIQKLFMLARTQHSMRTHEDIACSSTKRVAKLFISSQASHYPSRKPGSTNTCFCNQCLFAPFNIFTIYLPTVLFRKVPFCFVLQSTISRWQHNEFARSISFIRLYHFHLKPAVNFSDTYKVLQNNEV